jgi:flagellar hook-length control protein FliK
MHGIRNDEHHLVLRLYPQELGEVKVDLLVRDGQVSINFNMENSRVKEMLESNMEQFRENMEQKGFSLGECSVSVGQRDDFDNEWRRFMMVGNSKGLDRETLEDLPDDALYLRGDMLQLEGRGDSLSLFV